MKTKILVIDDEKVIVDLVQKWLRNEGYDVVTYTDTKNILLRIEEEKPDMLIVDILLPGISGFDICQSIRDMSSLSHLPILLMSAVYKDFTVKMKASAIANGFIEKPLKHEELIEKVRNIKEPEKGVSVFQPEREDDAFQLTDPLEKKGQPKGTNDHDDLKVEYDDSSPFILYDAVDDLTRQEDMTAPEIPTPAEISPSSRKQEPVPEFGKTAKKEAGKSGSKKIDAELDALINMVKKKK